MLFFFSVAETISQLFINLLKLVSLPIIFLSIVSTASGMENIEQIKRLGQKVIKYTLLTTVIAATVALALFIGIDPVKGMSALASTTVDMSEGVLNPVIYHFLFKLFHLILFNPLMKIMSLVFCFLPMLLSFAIVSLPSQHRTVLHSFFSSIYAAIIAITRWIVAVMPIAIWAFITLFMRDLSKGLDVKSLALYLTCVLAANLIQAFIVLPSLLKLKKFLLGKWLKECFLLYQSPFLQNLQLRLCQWLCVVQKKMWGFQDEWRVLRFLFVQQLT